MSHPDLPSVVVEITDAIQNGGFRQRLKGLPHGSAARMESVLQLLDVRARGWVKLVTNIDVQNAFCLLLLDNIARTAWIEFAGCQIEQSDQRDPKAQSHWCEITARIEYWKVQGFRRLTSEKPETKATAPTRRGYRDHIRGWMKLHGIRTIAIAAKRLGVSESTLKSIMTTKGEIRYSPDTLARILKETNYQKNGE
jgi:hypothetical protein